MHAVTPDNKRLLCIRKCHECVGLNKVGRRQLCVLSPVDGLLVVDDVHHRNALDFISTPPRFVTFTVTMYVSATDDEQCLIVDYESKMADSGGELISLLDGLLIQIEDQASEAIRQYDRLVPQHCSQKTTWLGKTLRQHRALFGGRAELLYAVEANLLVRGLVSIDTAEHINRHHVRSASSAHHGLRQLSDRRPLVPHRIEL